MYTTQSGSSVILGSVSLSGKGTGSSDIVGSVSPTSPTPTPIHAPTVFPAAASPIPTTSGSGLFTINDYYFAFQKRASLNAPTNHEIVRDFVFNRNISNTVKEFPRAFKEFVLYKSNDF